MQTVHQLATGEIMFRSTFSNVLLSQFFVSLRPDRRQVMQGYSSYAGPPPKKSSLHCEWGEVLGSVVLKTK